MFSRNANMISKPLQQGSSSPFQNDLNVILDSRLNFEEHLNILKKQQDLLPRSALVKSSVIRQKGKSQNGCFEQTRRAKFFENRRFLSQ